MRGRLVEAPRNCNLWLMHYLHRKGLALFLSKEGAGRSRRPSQVRISRESYRKQLEPPSAQQKRPNKKRQRLKSPPPTHGLYRGNNTMLRLTPPKHVTFFISVAVAVIAVIIHYANVAIPYVHSGFVILLIGYLVLLAGNVLEGV
jgi:hypothetical protein